ncbi:MAG: twin-arginine translocase TatA/TatE family subunit [Proteobacteria bacterium]|nr:twin-arginine translocase TatA/TatE family subunit [Pseudomonadota bacterium]
MFGLGMPELIIILVIIMIIFGAGKLPEIGAGLGKAIKGFKNSANEIEAEVKSATSEGDTDNKA